MNLKADDEVECDRAGVLGCPADDCSLGDSGRRSLGPGAQRVSDAEVCASRSKGAKLWPMGLTIDEIREMEGRRLAALVSRDMAAADQLHADDYELINPLGGALSKVQYLGAIESGQLTYARFEPVSEIDVLLGAEFAVLRYQAAIAFPPGGPAEPAVYWHTDVYLRRDERWQAVRSQATLISTHR